MSARGRRGLALRGVALVPHEEVFAVERSLPHGHVQAVLGVMRALGMDTLLAARPCRERDLVLAMIAQRLLDPCSKLATTRVWHTTTLAQELGVDDADANDLYAALDWLHQRQRRIEKKLAARHLTDGAGVLFDVSSSSCHGRTCPLARRGYNRDGEKLPSIVYGLLTDGAGRPVAVDVYPGNTGDPATVPDQVEKLRARFRLQRVVLVGDRGMLTHTQIDALRRHPGVAGFPRCAFRPFARSPSTARSNPRSSIRRTSPRSPAPTIPANGSWCVTTRPWLRTVPGRVTNSWPPPKRASHALRQRGLGAPRRR